MTKANLKNLYCPSREVYSASELPENESYTSCCQYVNIVRLSAYGNVRKKVCVVKPHFTQNTFMRSRWVWKMLISLKAFMFCWRQSSFLLSQQLMAWQHWFAFALSNKGSAILFKISFLDKPWVQHEMKFTLSIFEMLVIDLIVNELI